MENARDEMVSALEKLAAALGERGYETALTTAQDRQPSLSVSNPRARQLSKSVMAQDGWFWWPWADRIAPMSSISEAADWVARVLAATPEPTHG